MASERVQRFLNEVVSTCPYCLEPVKRNQARHRVGTSEKRRGEQWWKFESTGGTIAHLSCEAPSGG